MKDISEVLIDTDMINNDKFSWKQHVSGDQRDDSNAGALSPFTTTQMCSLCVEEEEILNVDTEDNSMKDPESTGYLVTYIYYWI